MFLSHDDYVLKLILADQYDEKQSFVDTFFVNNSLVDIKSFLVIAQYRVDKSIWKYSR